VSREIRSARGATRHRGPGFGGHVAHRVDEAGASGLSPARDRDSALGSPPIPDRGDVLSCANVSVDAPRRTSPGEPTRRSDRPLLAADCLSRCRIAAATRPNRATLSHPDQGLA
jgi:hypothetical protein